MTEVDAAAALQPQVRTIEVRAHGRYLLHVPDSPPPWPLLVGFHGYGEDAETHLTALAGLPGARQWLIVSIQALHRFYRRDRRIAASWMTRQDRELEIADNVDYVGRVLTDVRAQHTTRNALVFVGFSQGGAMAYRAAARYRSDALIVLAADVPPDVAAARATSLPPILIGRGTTDDWYTEAKHTADVTVLSGIGATFETCVFEGGHEWGTPFRDAAGAVLRRANSG